MTSKTMAEIIAELHEQTTVAVRPGLEYARRIQDLRSGSRTSHHVSGKAYTRSRNEQERRREVDLGRG